MKFAELVVYYPQKERMWQLVFFTLSCDLLLAAAYSNFRKSMDSIGKRQYQVQHGSCSYTFLLPEMDNCRSPSGAYVPNAVQRDAPLDYDDSVQRLQLLENIMENNTQWLMKVGSHHSLVHSSDRLGLNNQPGGVGRGAMSLGESWWLTPLNELPLAVVCPAA